MFYTAIFLGGEWAQFDFTWPGKILCCVLCIVGIALFAIPVGTVFEGFQEVLEELYCEEEHEEGVQEGKKEGREEEGEGRGNGGWFGIKVGPWTI